MPPRMTAQVDIQFLGGERYAYGIVPYRRLEMDLPAKPGLYSWHFRIPKKDPESASAFLHRLFVNSKIDVTATSNLRQSWSGGLQSDVEPFKDLGSTALADFFFALAYPVYIGISQDLSRRLVAHKKELNTWRVAEGWNFTNAEEQAIISDTAEESRTFGRRLGAIFREAQFTGTDWLYVKHYTPTQCHLSNKCASSAVCLQSTMAELRKAEWTFNTLFHPALGRR